MLSDFHFKLCRGPNAEVAAVLGEVLDTESTTVGAEGLDSSDAERWLGAVDFGAEVAPSGDDGCLLVRSLGAVNIEAGLVIDRSLPVLVVVASDRSGRSFEHQVACAYPHVL